MGFTNSFHRILLTASLLLPAHSGVATAKPPPGAMIEMSMRSTVGVLLDEIPAGALRDRAAANALAKGPAFWLGRASRQVRLTSYYLVFRGSFYPTPNYGPLPLPPESVWNLQLHGAAHRTTVNGHDVVAIGYTFGSYMITDPASPALVDPNLGHVGGIALESFDLPVDPELLLERTGFSCMDEFEFPPGSVFEENTWYYYDSTCVAGINTCHVTVQPTLACVDALDQNVGRVHPTMEFERVQYDAALASAYRVGTVTPAAKVAGSAADLAVVTAGMRDERDFVMRFFAPGSCELGEGVIGQYGWRRLLTFSAIVRNDGTAPIDLGDVSDPTNPYVASNAFEYSPCHHHYHFSHYGTFSYAGGVGSKRAFCLEDTSRYHNDETTQLPASHQTCANQGITAGWGDEYNFGIPGQWVDVTGRNTSLPQPLTFDSNPDQFLCEGTLQYGTGGNLLFVATPFFNLAGLPETRVSCNFLPEWNINNHGEVQVSSPGGSFVTDECTRGQLGPNRNCGFAPPTAQPRSCTTGDQIELTCTATDGAPAVVRICEVSGQLHVGVACTLADAKTNAIVRARPTAVRFSCPAVRDAVMTSDIPSIPQSIPGVGGYSVYRAALGLLGDADESPPAVTCTGQ